MLPKFSYLVPIISFFMAQPLMAVPYELSYGGRLTEASGKPVDGPVVLRAKFFRSSSGNDEVAVAVPDFSGVALVDGIFQITIVLTPTEFHVAFNNADPVWIQISDVTHSITYPRQKFSITPYALKVPIDDNALTWTSDGKLSVGKQGKIDFKGASSDYAITLKAADNQASNQTLVLPQSVGTAGQFLKTDGTGVMQWQSISGGGDMLGTNNLSELTNVAAARAYLGLGDSAVKNVGTTAADVAVGNHGHTVGSISGLGDAAVKNVGTGATNVAAGNHSHANATSGADGMMSAADKSKLDGISSGAGAGLTSLAGQTGANQSFAVGSAGTGPAWSSATNTHTLNLPLASGAGVSAGLLSKVDYDSFAAKQGALGYTPANTAGATFTGPVIVAVPGPTTFDAVTIKNSQRLLFENTESTPNSIRFRAPSGVFSNQSYVLPGANPTAGQVLQSDGSGNLSWWTPGNSVTSLAQITVSCTTGQVIKSTGGGGWSCQSDNDTAGTGTTTPADASVSTVKLVDGAVTAAKLNAMGCVNGQILKTNGTTWSCAADDNNNVTTNASLLTTGTLPDARLSTNVSQLGSTIDTAEITNGAVTNAKLGTGSEDVR